MDDNVKKAYEDYLKLKKENPPINEFGGFQEIIDKKQKEPVQKEPVKLTNEEIDILMASVSLSELSE